MHELGRTRRGLCLWVGLLLLAWPALDVALASDTPAAPHPELSPAEVVRLQVESLGANDERNLGIDLAFRFASPANRRQTGPLPRFIEMIKRDPYRLMLEYDRVVYGEVEVVERVAQQRITLLGPRAMATFVFLLSKQTEGPWKDCWLTDAVLVEPTEVQTI